MATISMVGRILAIAVAAFTFGCSELIDGIATSSPQKLACGSAGSIRIGAEWKARCVQGLDVANGECEIAQCVGVGDAAAIAQTYQVGWPLATRSRCKST